MSLKLLLMLKLFIFLEDIFKIDPKNPVYPTFHILIYLSTKEKDAICFPLLSNLTAATGP